MNNSPRSGVMTLASSRATVVFPEPLSPTRPVTVPAERATEKSSTAQRRARRAKMPRPPFTEKDLVRFLPSDRTSPPPTPFRAQAGDRPRGESDGEVLHRAETRPAGEDAATALHGEVLGEVPPLQGRLRGDRCGGGRGARCDAHRELRRNLGAAAPIAPGAGCSGSGRARSWGTLTSPAWSQQAAVRPDSARDTSVGVSDRHRSIAHGQRGWKAHP